MPPAIATLIFGLGILGLFVLDRDDQPRTSKALWIPIAWLLIAGSRMVSQWLDVAPALNLPDQYLDGSPLDRLVLTGLLVIGIVVLLQRYRKVGTLLRTNGPILLYFFYCGVSILWSDYPEVAFKRWTKALGDVVMVFVVLSDPYPSAALKRLIARTGFLLVPLSVLLIKYYPDLGRAYDAWVGTPVYIGVATDKNLLGMVCLVWGVGFTWRFLQEFRDQKHARRTGRLIAHGFVLAAVLWLLIKSNSATSLACFLLAGGLIAVTSLPTLVRKPAIVHLFLGGVVVFVLFGALYGADASIVEAMGRNLTLTGRTELWHRLIGMVVNPWFGTGFESFWLGQRLDALWSQYWWHPNQAHNGYLEVFLNLGWAGVASLAIVMVTGYRNVVRTFRSDPDAGRVRLGYFVVAVFYSLTEAAFRMMHPVWILFLLAVTDVPTVLCEKQNAQRHAVKTTSAISLDSRPAWGRADVLGQRNQID